jgi:hypothetical protein
VTFESVRANSVVSNRQARAATKAYIKAKLQMELTDSEKRSLDTKSTARRDPTPQIRTADDLLAAISK